MTPKLYTLDDVDPNWSARWRLGADMVLPVPTVYLHHTVTVPTSDVLGDAAKVDDIDQGRFGKISYSWNVHGLTYEWIEAETTHRGAHTINNQNQSLNGISFGVGVIGNFQPNVPGIPTNTVTEELLDSIAEGIDAFVKPHLTDGFVLLAHRNVYATACNGDLLYGRMDDIRSRLGHPPSPVPPPAPPEDSMKFVYVRHHDPVPGASGTNDPRVFGVAVGFRPSHVVNFADFEHAVSESGNFVWVDNPDGTENVDDGHGNSRKVQIVNDAGAAAFGLPTAP